MTNHYSLAQNLDPDAKTPQKKRALVLGGGGSRGSYTMGALAALIEQRQTYSLITGISIGSLVGGVFAMDQPINYQKLISSFSNESVATGLFEFPKRNSVLTDKPQGFTAFVDQYQVDGPSVAPLKSNYEKIFDFDAFKNSNIDYACLAADLTTNQPKLFKKSEMKTKDDAVMAMLASSAYFPAFSFVKIGDDYYADGGYLNSQLGKYAVENGYEDLTVIALSDPNAPLDYCKEQTSLLIRPILKLEYFLDFDKDVMIRQIAQGELEALKFMNLAPGYLYTFYKEDAFLFRNLSKMAVAMLEKNHIKLSSDMLIDGMSELLGYRPGELNNTFMQNYEIGLLFECLGLIAGLDLYTRYRLMPFLKELLERLRNYEVNITPAETGETLKMDTYGARDLMSFFHNALKVNDGKLPEQFDQVINKFKSLFYLAIAWYVLEKFSLVINLFSL